MKRLLLNFTAALLLLFPLAAFAGGIEPRQLNQNLRTNNYTVESFVTGQVSAGTSSITCTVGVDSCIYKSSRLDTMGSTRQQTATGTIAGLQHPVRLQIRIVDGSANNTIVCGSVSVAGTDQFGINHNEAIILTADDTDFLTTYAYEKVTSIVVSSCTGATDSTDVVLIYASKWLGLPYPIKSVSDIVSICGKPGPGMGLQKTKCMTNTQIANLTVNGLTSTIDMTGITGANLLGENNTNANYQRQGHWRFKVRANAY